MRLLIRFAPGMSVWLLSCIWSCVASAGRLDLKYLYFWDRNGVWSHTPALRLEGSPFQKTRMRWEQEIDMVSGASRRLGMRGVFAGLGGRKDIESFSLGLFQTLTPFSLAGMTIEYIRGDGYLGHPYLPVIMEGGGLILERTPRMRNSLAATASWIQGYRISERLGSLHLKLGAYGDDWGLRSQSCEAQWHQYLRGTLAVRFRMRFYRQDPAAFAREHYSGREAYRVADIRYFGFRTLSGGLRFSGGFPDMFSDWLPDRWDIGYDQGTRDTRGEEGTGAPFHHYQLFPVSDYYREGRFLAGLGFDW